MVKFKSEKVKIYVIVTFGPFEGGEVEECKTFPNRLNMLGNLNGWIGDLKKDI